MDKLYPWACDRIGWHRLGGADAPAAGSGKGEREAQQEYHQPSYGGDVSFKSVLVVVLVMVALIVGDIIVLT